MKGLKRTKVSSRNKSTPSLASRQLTRVTSKFQDQVSRLSSHESTINPSFLSLANLANPASVFLPGVSRCRQSERCYWGHAPRVRRACIHRIRWQGPTEASLKIADGFTKYVGVEPYSYTLEPAVVEFHRRLRVSIPVVKSCSSLTIHLTA